MRGILSTSRNPDNSSFQREQEKKSGEDEKYVVLARDESGWEVVSCLCEGSEFEGVLIIALTAHVSKADQERALEVGCNAHLGKPFDVTEVLEVVERYLKQ